MPNDHPFQLLFETLGRVPLAHADLVNRRAFESLASILSVPVSQTGRCILLRAPRAGHGKTHLLSCIQHQLGGTSEFIPLLAANGSRIDAATVTDDTLRRLVRQLPASGGLTVLDLVSRRLFASALQPLVGSGEVPCQDRDGALTALRTRPIETFDFHHPNAVTAHWARENFEVLGQRLSLELAQRADLPVSDVSFWVEELFHFASAPLDQFARVRTLAEHVHQSPGAEMERLQALLGLLTMLTRVVLVADDLEGFSADETAALKLAAFLGALRQNVERVDVILSLNQDVWQSAFLPRLSDGLADRLSEVVVELQPLTEPEMVALLESRVPGLGTRVLDRIDLRDAGTHARGIIRAAGITWIQAANSADSAPILTPTQESSEMENEPTVSVEPEIAETAPEEPVQEVEAAAEPFSSFGDLPDFSASFNEAAFSWPTPEFDAPPPAETLSSGKSDEAEEVEDYFMAPPSLTSEEPKEEESFIPDPWQQPFPTSAPFALDPWQSTEAATDPAAPFALPPEPRDSAAPVDPEDDPFDSAGWLDSSPFSIPSSRSDESTEEKQVDSPFQAFAAEESQPAPFVFTAEPAFVSEQGPETIVSPAAPPEEVSPPPAPADSDRVDDLLRQFRERYGRGSL